MKLQNNVSLETLKQGACIEMFNKQLETVIADIDNPNSKADATRVITLTVKIKPDKNRAHASTVIECSSKLAPARSEDTTLYFGLQDGVTVVSEVYQDQLPLDYTGDEKPADDGDNNEPAVADNVESIRKNGDKK